MVIRDFLERCHGDVRIVLHDGTTHTGRFRMDLVTPSALSAYFYGDDRDISLPIHLIASSERIDRTARAS